MSIYLKYTIENMEPIRISDDSSSQNGQTATLRYIPGTSIRGYIIHQLAKESDFEQIKKDLFSTKTRYLNAYLNVAGKTLLPSPKGFYEDKTVTEGKKPIQNVVSQGEFKEGYKRASIGRYCYWKNRCIYYYNVETSSDLKIKINVNENEKQNVFRNEYIAANHIFTGYIAVEDRQLGERIRKVFKDTMLIGNSRSSGLGKCKILECNFIEQMPYEDYLPKQNIKSHCYMMLLSNTSMMGSNGELCGLDLVALCEKMNVSNLKIKSCSTSTVAVRGYNRTWGTKIPSVVMYEQGSVFQLTFDGELTVDKMGELVNEGIGIRRNEGFGRILFLCDYETLEYKQAEKNKKEYQPKQFEHTNEDREVLKVAARGYFKNKIHSAIEHYVVENPLKMENSSNSQLGMIESMISMYKYKPQEGKEKILAYLNHSEEKGKKQNVQKVISGNAGIGEIIQFIFFHDLNTVLGIAQKSVMGMKIDSVFSNDELDKMKFVLIQKLIRYYYKEEDV